MGKSKPPLSREDLIKNKLATGREQDRLERQEVRAASQTKSAWSPITFAYSSPRNASRVPLIISSTVIWRYAAEIPEEWYESDNIGLERLVEDPFEAAWNDPQADSGVAQLNEKSIHQLEGLGQAPCGPYRDQRPITGEQHL